MTAKITASADGTKVFIGTAAEDALRIDSVAKTIGAVAPYVFEGLPAGAMQMFFMNTAPAGWLAADGSLVSRTTYAALFAAIGTLYGAGDGSTTFQLPDMRGYFARASGTNADGTAAGTFGAKQADSNLAHTHATGSIASGSVAGSAWGNNAPLNSGFATATQSSGGTESRPKNIALLCCIKT